MSKVESRRCVTLSPLDILSDEDDDETHTVVARLTLSSLGRGKGKGWRPAPIGVEGFMLQAKQWLHMAMEKLYSMDEEERTEEMDQRIEDHLEDYAQLYLLQRFGVKVFG